MEDSSSFRAEDNPKPPIVPPIFCKVCQAVVPRRTTYAPKICEACQKFFRRHCQNGENGESQRCSKKTLNCEIVAENRRMCKRCRFQKCIAVGMKSKYYSANQTEETEVQNDHLKEVKTLALVRDPQIFDGSAIEGLSKTCAFAFTILHDYYSLPLSDPNSISGSVTSSSNVAMIDNHLTNNAAVAYSYGQTFFTFLNGLTIEDLDVLKNGFVPYIGIFFSSLPNAGTISFYGGNEQQLPYFISLFPEIKEIVAHINVLRAMMADWNPPFIITSVLFGLILFNEASLTVPKLARIRRQLLLALEMLSSQLSGGDANYVDDTRIRFREMVPLLKKCLSVCFRTIKAIGERMAAISPEFQNKCEMRLQNVPSSILEYQ